MGQRGPAPKPSQLKHLYGTYRADRAPANEAFPDAPLFLDAPEYLTGGAADKWAELAPMLSRNGLLTEADLDALALYCSTWKRWREAEDAIEEHGSVTTAQSGYKQASAHTTLAKQYRSDLLKLGDRLGLNPSVRSRIHVGQSAEKVDDLLS